MAVEDNRPPTERESPREGNCPQLLLRFRRPTTLHSG